MMRLGAQEGLVVRRATQVQARNQQLAAGEGRDDDVLLLTHGTSLAGRRRRAQ